MRINRVHLMRSLTLKLTLAFLLVGLTGSIVVALSVRLQTQQRFNQFVVRVDSSEIVANLLTYYEKNGSWDGVQKDLVGVGPTTGSSGGPHRSEPFPITVVDPSGQVVYGRPDQIGQHLQFDSRLAVPLKTGSDTIGWLVLGFPDRPFQPGTPESDFLRSVGTGILYSAVVATALALVIGILLARTISQPIRELRTATQVVAGGDLGYQVTVHTKDELGQLASSFNRMSTDLAHANDLRRQMTADIAHDLRTPLSIILGYTEALSERKLEGSPDTFKVMHEEAQHLQRLVEDLRTLSLADAGELPLMQRDVAPAALLERVALSHRPHAQGKNIVIDVTASTGLPAIHVDPDRMAQVLDNLIANALRYTPEGGRIELVAEGRDSQVLLKVKDNGSGIPAEDVPHIFERFYRADRSRGLREGESGLGLSIARSIVEAHGGTISVESVADEGSTFIITLPAAPET